LSRRYTKDKLRIYRLPQEGTIFDEEGEMKKGFFAVLLGLFIMGSLHTMIAQETRIYNDGEIDYAPLEAGFVLTAEDMESTVKEIRYSVNGSAAAVYDNPIILDREGRNVIVYWAVDRTDNVSSEKIYSVIVDATPPEGFVSVHGPAFMEGDLIYLTAGSTIVVWAEDQLSGVDAVYVSLDESSFAEYTNPVSISEEGYHTASAYAVDNVGNRTDVFSVEGYVDSTPPRVSITTREDFVEVAGESYTNRVNEFTVTASDEYAGVQDVLVSLDGSEYVAYTAPFKVQQAGSHVVRAIALDRLGNRSAPAELSFYVDVTPPSTTMGVTLEE
jgi:hypothetical protein